MSSLRMSIAAAVLGSGAMAQAAPILPQNEINEQLARIDLAGVHYWDTQEQVRATMLKGGWTLETATLLGESFRDKVGQEVSRRYGRRYVLKDGHLPAIEEYVKGAQRLQVDYAPHSRGNLAITIRYSHANATSGPLLEAFIRKVEEKFRGTPLVEVQPDLYCLQSDARCLAAPSNGGVLSTYPSVYLNGSMVILHEGEGDRAAFAKDFDDAVAKQSGGLDDLSL